MTAIVTSINDLEVRTHRATILSDTVCEAAVALCSNLNLVGALEQKSLLQVARSLVHVCNAVLAVVCNILGGLSRHEAQEGELNVDILRLGALAAVLKLGLHKKVQENEQI